MNVVVKFKEYAKSKLDAVCSASGVSEIKLRCAVEVNLAPNVGNGHETADIVGVYRKDTNRAIYLEDSFGVLYSPNKDLANVYDLCRIVLEF